MLLTVTFYPLNMAIMLFLDSFRPNRLTKHSLGAELTFLVAKIFYILLPQYVSKSLGTLTQKVGNFPNPPPFATAAGGGRLKKGGGLNFFSFSFLPKSPLAAAAPVARKG